MTTTRPDDRRLVWNWRRPTTGAARAALRQRCITLYVHQGLSLAAVGKLVDRNPDTVSRLIVEAGYTIRPRNNPNRRPMVRLELGIPAEFQDALREYARLRGMSYNDAVLACLGRVLGLEWDGRRQPNGYLR